MLACQLVVFAIPLTRDAAVQSVLLRRLISLTLTSLRGHLIVPVAVSILLLTSGCNEALHNDEALHNAKKRGATGQSSFLQVVRRVRIPGVVLAEAASPRELLLTRQVGARPPELSALSPKGTLRSIPSDSIGGAPQALIFAFDSIWVTNGVGDSPSQPARLAGTVARINPMNGSLRSLVALRGSPSGITATRSSIWVTAGNALRRIDDRSDRLTALVKLPPRAIVRLAATSRGPAIAVTSSGGRSAVWVIREEPSLRVRRGHHISSRIYAIAAGGARLWLSLSDQVAELRSRDLSLVARSRVLHAPGMIVPLSGGRAFVAEGDGKVVLLRAIGSVVRVSAVAHIGNRADALFRVGKTFFAYDTVAHTMTILRRR
jgi:hypothetical protein